jgi:hypothetical protein
MRNVADKICRENQIIILCSVIFFSRKIRDVYKGEKCTATEATDEERHMRLARRIINALRICNNYCASTLRYAYVVCLLI